MAKRQKRLTVADLEPDPANPRAIDAEAAAGLRSSLGEFGDVSGIVWNRRTGKLVAGHQRMSQLREVHGEGLRLKHDARSDWAWLECPNSDRFRVRIVDWDPVKGNMANIAANNPAIAGEFTEALDGQLEEIGRLDPEKFAALRLDELERGLIEDSTPVETRTIGLDKAAELQGKWSTESGQLWEIGRHRLCCGDNSDAEATAKACNGGKVDLLFTSPPYTQRREYQSSSGVTWLEMMRGCVSAAPLSADVQILVNLGIVHESGEWSPYWDKWIGWMRKQGWRRFGWYVWDQGHGLPGNWNGRLAPSHEFVFHFNKTTVEPSKCVQKQPGSIKARNHGQSTFPQPDGTTKTFTNPSASAQPTKIPDSVIRVTRQSGNDGHPAQFPVKFARAVLEAWSGSVYDPFIGSGTTMVAAEQLGRTCYGVEISPAYCAVVLERMSSMGLECKLL